MGREISTRTMTRGGEYIKRERERERAVFGARERELTTVDSKKTSFNGRGKGKKNALSRRITRIVPLKLTRFSLSRLDECVLARAFSPALSPRPLRLSPRSLG